MEDAIEVHTIPWSTIEEVLYSEDEFDGMSFNENDDGVTVVHFYGGSWTFHLFLLALAHKMGPVLEPHRQGYQQIFHTLLELTIDMPFPVPAPQDGKDYFACQLPNIRIEWPEPPTSPRLPNPFAENE